MRLLRADTDDLILETVEGEVEKYAILSHRWLAAQEEVTYADLAHGTIHSTIRSKKGWKKLKWCRQQAVKDGYRYVWADTVCIDKSSSQELTESINSMYRWYEQAECCYVYLHDMPDRTSARRGNTQADAVSSVLYDWDQEAFRNCAWFTRAWTLQEMIAPNTLRFYSQSWTFIGELQDMAQDISRFTGVHAEVLTKQRPLASYSIAQKMSWAAGRSATKIEDRAYSLLGIMDVAMSVIYGEREHAFRRLQDELLRTSSDDSIFAFGDTTKRIRIQGYDATTLTADSPEAFRDCGKIALASWHSEKTQYQMVSKEINFRMRVLVARTRGARPRWRSLINSKNEGAQRYQAILQCYIEGSPSELMTLNLFSLQERPTTFYVDGRGPRVIAVSVHREKERPCPYKGFSVVDNPAEIANSLGLQDDLILCECKIQDFTLQFVDASTPNVWHAKDTSFIVPSTDSDFKAELEIWTGQTYVATVYVSTTRDNSERSVRIDFGARSIHLSRWTILLLRQNSYQCAVIRTNSTFLIAKAFSRKHPFGHQNVCLVVTEELGFTRFILFVMYRIVLLLAFLLLCLAGILAGLVSFGLVVALIPLFIIWVILLHSREFHAFPFGLVTALMGLALAVVFSIFWA